ncbi:MAG: exosortase A, partial [Sphingomonadaceae bacterium]
MMHDVNASAVTAPATSAARPAHHQSPADLVAAGMALAILAVAQHASYASMLAVWHRSATFAHGYLILPISLWLIWRQRDSLLRVPRQPALTGLLLLGVLVLVWLLAAVANVSALMQYSATLMVAATVATVLGWRLTRAMAFPLAYLLLAVPFGEVLIPPMIEFTARFTVFALQCSGLPVFRDNNHLILSSGSWDVVEACSGLRYLMASLALGALFAHLNYHSNARKLAFLGVSLLLPVLANGVRAYLIVMLGHLSDMRLAAGVDHLIYGWLFF